MENNERTAREPNQQQPMRFRIEPGDTPGTYAVVDDRSGRVYGDYRSLRSAEHGRDRLHATDDISVTTPEDHFRVWRRHMGGHPSIPVALDAARGHLADARRRRAELPREPAECTPRQRAGKNVLTRRIARLEYRIAKLGEEHGGRGLFVFDYWGDITAAKIERMTLGDCLHVCSGDPDDRPVTVRAVHSHADRVTLCYAVNSGDVLYVDRYRDYDPAAAQRAGIYPGRHRPQRASERV